MKKNKTFKTYEEQLEILNSKGLVTDNNSLNILKRNNYYFLINRYKDLFIIPNSKPNKFKEGTHFNEIVSVYNFERDLRMTLLKYIITIENTLKSVISHEFAKRYGHNYLDINSYDTLNNDKERLSDIKGLFNTIKRTIKKGIKENEYIKYYNSNYSEIPFWVVINDLSFGNIVGLYNIMYEEIKSNISNEFKMNSNEFYKSLRVLHYFRNLAAHNQRTFDSKANETIEIDESHKELQLSGLGLNDVMSVIIICKKILEKKDYDNFIFELKAILEELDKNIETISIDTFYKKMGINKNSFN